MVWLEDDAENGSFSTPTAAMGSSTSPAAAASSSSPAAASMTPRRQSLHEFLASIPGFSVKVASFDAWSYLKFHCDLSSCDPKCNQVPCILWYAY